MKKPMTVQKFDRRLILCAWISFGMALLVCIVPLIYYGCHVIAEQQMAGNQVVAVDTMRGILKLADGAFFVLIPGLAVGFACLGLEFWSLLRKRRQLNIREMTEPSSTTEG